MRAAGREFDSTDAGVQVRVPSVGMAGRRNRVCTASQMTGEMRFRSADMATLGTPAVPVQPAAGLVIHDARGRPTART